MLSNDGKRIAIITKLIFVIIRIAALTIDLVRLDISTALSEVARDRASTPSKISAVLMIGRALHLC